MCGRILASGFYLTQDDLYVLAGNMSKKGVEDVKRQEKVKRKMNYAFNMVAFLSYKYKFGRGVYLIYHDDDVYGPDPTTYTKGGPDDLEYILITQIRSPKGVVKPIVAAADEYRKAVCMDVLRRYGIEGDLSERWCTIPSAHISCLDWNLADDAAKSRSSVLNYLSLLP